VEKPKLQSEEVHGVHRIWNGKRYKSLMLTVCQTLAWSLSFLVCSTGSESQKDVSKARAWYRPTGLRELAYVSIGLDCELAGQGVFLSWKLPQLVLRPTQPHIKLVLGSPSLWVKWPGCKETTPLLLMLRSRMSGTVPPLHLKPSWHKHEQITLSLPVI
jgi:hypothetical protein